jgi:hypothetical protein
MALFEQQFFENPAHHMWHIPIACNPNAPPVVPAGRRGRIAWRSRDTAGRSPVESTLYWPCRAPVIRHLFNPS